MTDSASQSLVERAEMMEALADQRRRMGSEFDELNAELMRVRSVAAARITELEAERDDLLAKCSALLWAIPDDVAGKLTCGELKSLRDRAKNSLPSKTTLSRVEGETIERCAKVAESVALTAWPLVEDAQRRCPTANMKVAIASAIRSLPPFIKEG